MQQTFDDTRLDERNRGLQERIAALPRNLRVARKFAIYKSDAKTTPRRSPREYQ